MNSCKWLLLFLFFSFSFNAFTQSLPEEDLVLYVNFDGRQAIDKSTNEHFIFKSNINFGEGIHNEGLLLDGAESFLEIPHSTATEIPKTYTSSVWYKHTLQESSSFYSLIEQSADEFGGHSRYGTWIFDRHKVQTCVEPDFCVTGGQFCQRCVSATEILEIGKWYHIASSYDGEFLSLYINGKINNQRKFEDETGISIRPYPLHIGTDIYANNPVYLKGMLDEIRLYNTALTAEQIGALYQEFSQTTSLAILPNPSIHVFPNPVVDHIYIESNEPISDIFILNTYGQVVKHQTTITTRGLDVTGLVSGIYFLTFTIGTNHYRQKIVLAEN